MKKKGLKQSVVKAMNNFTCSVCCWPNLTNLWHFFHTFLERNISFTSYKQPIRISNFGNEICLFTFWVNTYKTKVLNKGQSTSKNANITVWTKNLKTLCYLHLKLVTLIFVFRKIGCSYELNEIPTWTG